MGSYGVIARTSETLLELLRERIHARPDAIDVDRHMIALASPDDVDEDSDVRLGLHLYEVTSNDVMNTNTRAYVDEESETMRDPPLALDLKYLLTAYPAQTNGDVTPESIDQQRLLGLAIQTLNDNSMIDGTEFGGTQFDKNVGITLQPESSSSVPEIWRSLQESTLRPSIVYEVTPVLIDSLGEEEVPRVEERGMEYEDKEEEGARQETRSPDADA